MSDIVERIDAMIEGHASRHGIAINDVVELLSDAKDVLLGLPPEAYKATGGGDNSLSSSVPPQSELNKLRAELAYKCPKCEWRIDRGTMTMCGGCSQIVLPVPVAIAQAIRALKSPKPPIL